MLPFAAIRMGLEGIMLGEISQKNMVYHIYLESKKYKSVNIMRKKQMHTDIECKTGYKDVLCSMGNIANIL